MVSGYFEYGLTTAYGTKTAAEEFSGAIPVAFKARLEGLAGATVYHYRLVAVGATGSVFGADVAFSTAAEAPLAATGMPKDVTTSTATFQGAVDPKVLATQLHFEYGFTTAYGRSTSAETVAAGAGYGEVTTPVADLIPNVTYHCRIVATNAVGTTAGEDVAFVSAAGGPPGGIITLPVVTTGAVARVSTTSAILLGEVDPKIGTTLARFEFGITESYGRTTADQGVGNGDAAVAVSLPADGPPLGWTAAAPCAGWLPATIWLSARKQRGYQSAGAGCHQGHFHHATCSGSTRTSAGNSPQASAAAKSLLAWYPPGPAAGGLSVKPPGGRPMCR